MRILHTVEFYSPSVGGSQEVVKQLSEHMVTLGHEVVVATTKIGSRSKKCINGVKIREFDISGNAIRGYQGKDIKKYQKFLTESKFDVVLNYAAQQWTSDLAFEVLGQIKARKIFVPCGYSGLYDIEYKQYFSKLPSILRKYDATVYLSHNYRDINFAKKHKLKNIVIIPNGADEREFGELNRMEATKFRNNFGIKENESLILSIGNHTGMKGHNETIKSFMMANISDAVLMLVGRIDDTDGCLRACKLSAWLNNNIIRRMFGKNKRVIIAELDRQETVYAYQAANIFLFLSNIECSPLVLFEAAASGLPFISSDVGNAREIGEWTKSGIICDVMDIGKGIKTANLYQAQHIIELLLSDKSKHRKLSINGRKLWEKNFTWEKISKQYLELYEGRK